MANQSKTVSTGWGVSVAPFEWDYEQKTGFGFSIPAGATINGIVVTYSNPFAWSNLSPFYARLMKSGADFANWESNVGFVPGISYGSSSDLWGGAWTADDINSSGFGVDTFCSNGDDQISYYWSCSAVTITVYYTPYVPPSPPGSFDLTYPTNGSTGRSLSGTLTWNSADNATTYDVYMDTNNPPTTKVSAAQAGTSYSYSGLSYNTTYYWKVVATNGAGNTTCNNIFSFTTGLPAAPGPFSLYFPTNNAINQPLAGTLVWGASLGATTYDVYLNGVKVSSGQAGTTYAYSGLTLNTSYTWSVVANNLAGSTSCTLQFSFTTYAVTPGTGNIIAFSNTAGSYRNYTYLSKRNRFKQTSFTCGKVLAENYPVNLSIIYPDIPYTIAVVVADNQPFRIDPMLTDAVDFLITGQGQVYGVFLAGQLEELPV